MAEIRSVYKYSIIFTVIACHAILSAEGRQIKSMNKKEVNSSMGETAKKISSSNNLLQNTQGKKELLPPTMSFGDSETSYKDDFRPTSPGNRPDISHSFSQDHENVESKLVGDNSQKARHFKTAGAKDDFRPTNPGHSPGVGHSFRN